MTLGRPTRLDPAPAAPAGDHGDAGAAGVEGNARLTAATGILLTLLLLVEGFTVLDVHGYLTLHVALGFVLIGPVALKSASTLWRFTAYYRGRSPYVRKGPPHIVLRLLGPLVLVSSVVLLATGVAVIELPGSRDTWLTLHQGSFIVWVAVMTIHFLGHIRAAAVDTVREARPALADPARRGRALRLFAVAASLLAGIALAAAFTPNASSLHRPDRGRFHDGRVHGGGPAH